MKSHYRITIKVIITPFILILLEKQQEELAKIPYLNEDYDLGHYACWMSLFSMVHWKGLHCFRTWEGQQHNDDEKWLRNYQRLVILKTSYFYHWFPNFKRWTEDLLSFSSSDFPKLSLQLFHFTSLPVFFFGSPNSFSSYSISFLLIYKNWTVFF